MALFGAIKKLFQNTASRSAETVSPASAVMPRFRVKVIEFSDNVEGSSGEIIARQLATREGIEVGYFDEPFNKSFLNLESRTLFDLIDKGQTILDKTGADVLLWGCREGSRIRLNFQVPSQYEDEELAFVSLMDSLYIPARPESENYPDAVINLIYGGLLSSLNAAGAQAKVYKRYLLKKIIDRLSKDNSAKTLSIEYMPYIMNFLGIIYLSYAFDKSDGRDFKIVKSLFDTAIKHQDLITSPIHLGCIYNHLGQLYDCATRYMDKNPAAYFKGAIEYYRLAQKYLSKYTYPYDYGYISYKLSKLFFNYWRQKEDIQALRDAVFQLREAEKIYTYALFPEFWAEIQGQLGYLLSLLGSFTKSEDISELAIASYKNRQKVITERRDPLLWPECSENIGDIYYRIGRNKADRAALEEALEHFHDALYIFENAQLSERIKKLTTDIARTNQSLNLL